MLVEAKAVGSTSHNDDDVGLQDSASSHGLASPCLASADGSHSLQVWHKSLVS